MANETATTIERVRTDVGITEGRVAIGVEGEAGTVRLETPTREVLSRHEPVITLEVSGDGFQGSLRFDADDVHDLARVLTDMTGATTEGDR